MATVDDYIACPRCSFDRASHEYRTRTFEETIWCHRCGYQYERTLNRDQNGDAALDGDGRPTYTTKETIAHGWVWAVDPDTGIGTFFFVDEPITEDVLADIQTKFDRYADPDRSWFVEYEKESRKIVPLIGSPPDFDDCEGALCGFEPLATEGKYADRIARPVSTETESDPAIPF